MQKCEYEKILGKNIRNDTYHILNMIIDKQYNYEQAKAIIEKNKSDYLLREGVEVCSRETVLKYLMEIEFFLQKPIQVGELDLDKFNDMKFRRYKKLKRQGKEINVLAETEKDDYGIYGIYVDDELIANTTFVGGIVHRSDMRNVKNKEDPMVLHSYLNKKQLKGNEISLKILINNKKINSKNTLTKKDWQAIELGLITLYQPRCNMQGIKISYVFEK